MIHSLTAPALTPGGKRSRSPMSYRIQLDVFEGPLDLLLHLIQKHELDIYDIPVALITQQYLEYLELMKSLEMNNRVVLFFDRAILAASMGYEEELMKYVETCKEKSLISKFFGKK